ncbi:MAG: recombinase family protein, partial [Chlorobi bacterium]|nr:recombinase family protein [Chlorobiota bacterium]
MKAIIFARVSTEEQKEAGNSLPGQIARLEKYSLEKGFDVVKKIEFDESAWKSNRKEFMEVINGVKRMNEKVVICCDKIDRLLRNFTKELLIIEELRMADKLELHFPSDNIILHKNSPASDLFRFTMGVSLAKYYSDSISDNVKRAYEKMVSNGQITCKAPIGYKNVKSDDGRKTVIVDEDKSDLIIRIFEFYSEGDHSMKRIAEIMEKEGLRSSYPGKSILRIRQIECILKNPFYYGFMKFHGKTYPHKYPPLISYDLWKQCELVRDRYKTNPKKHSNKPFVFQGLILCSRCGCRITPEIQKGKHIYYHCTNYHGNCKRIYVNQNTLLKPVRALLGNLKLSKEKIAEVVETLKMSEHAKNEFHDKEVKRLRAEHDKLKRRQRIMYEDRLDGRISEEMYEDLIKEYDDRLYDMRFKLSQFTNSDVSYYTTANTILSLCERAGELFDRSEYEEKREILKIVFQNFYLDGKKLEYKLKTPFQGVLQASESNKMGQLCDMFRTMGSINEFFPRIINSKEIRSIIDI